MSNTRYRAPTGGERDEATRTADQTPRIQSSRMGARVFSSTCEGALSMIVALARFTQKPIEQDPAAFALERLPSGKTSRSSTNARSNIGMSVANQPACDAGFPRQSVASCGRNLRNPVNRGQRQNG